MNEESYDSKDDKDFKLNLDETKEQELKNLLA